MKRSMLFLVLLLFPLTAIAGEKYSGTAFYVVDQQTWEISDVSGYWMWHGKGVAQTLEGPFEANAIECHGAGFWDKGASWGEGICVETDGDDTRTIHWKNDKGQKVGRWRFLGGTGKYAGITGEGTYTGQPLPGERHVTKWEGEVLLAE